MTWCRSPTGGCEGDQHCDALGRCRYEAVKELEQRDKQVAPVDPQRVVDALVPAALRELDEEGWAKKDAEVAADRDRIAAAGEEKRREELRGRLGEQGVPIKDIEACLANQLDETRALKVVRRWHEKWVEQRSCILILAGSLGVGKTTAAAWWICQPQTRPGYSYIKTQPILFLPAARLARWPKYPDDAKVSATNALPQAVKELFHAQALVIDDLGVEYDDKSGAFLSFFDELIDCRYAGRLPTVITSNVPVQTKDPKQPTLERRYGKRFIERTVIVGVEGESLRKKGPEK